MSINLTSNFSEQAALPLDDRCVAADIIVRNSIPAGRRHPGLLCWVESVEKLYVLRNDLITWLEIQTIEEEIYALLAGDDFYSFMYFGNFATDGSFRLFLSAGNLLIQKRVLALWETIASFVGDLSAPTNPLVPTFSANPVPFDGNDLFPYFHIGSYATDGSFRIIADGGDLKFEQQLAGDWKTIISFEESVDSPLNATTTFDTLENMPITGEDARPFVYIGAKTTNGSFRFIVDSGLKIEKRIAGNWYTLYKYEG